MAQYELNLRDYWRILRKRRTIIFGVAFLFVLFSSVLAWINRPRPIYESSAAVKFERTTSIAGLLIEVVAVSSGDNIATQAAIIRGFPVIERAAKRTGLLLASLSSEQIRQSTEHLNTLMRLQNQITAEQEGTSNIIKVTATADTPALAARLANAVAEAYREENIMSRNRQVREAKRFIEDQLTAVGDRLRAAEELLKTMKEREGVLALGESTATVLSRLTILEADYEKARRLRDEVARQMKLLRDGKAEPPKAGERAFLDLGDPDLTKMNSTLLDLQLERENLLPTLLPAHPQIKELDARIEIIREALLRDLGIKHQVLQARANEAFARALQAKTEARNLPEIALQLARLQRDVKINEDLFALLKTKYEEVQIREREQIEEVSIVRPAVEPTAPKNPSQTLAKTFLGLIIGLTIGTIMAFVMESLDTSIGTIEDVEAYLQAPVLGLIPNIDMAKELARFEKEEGAGMDESLLQSFPFLISLLSPQSTIAESYRVLRTTLEFLTIEKNLKALTITSASLAEGKTTTAINLAITLAQMGKRTLLVEADLRKPYLHHAFGIPKEPGLADVIVGNHNWKEVVKTVADLMLGRLGVEKIIASPNIDKLHIITSGLLPSNPAEFLTSQRMTELIAEFKASYDFVIFDSSPVLPVTDAVILGAKTDGTLIIYRVGRIARSALKRTKTLLESVHGRVLGLVLTGLKAEISPDYHDLEYYRYGYGVGADRKPSRAESLLTSTVESVRGQAEGMAHTLKKGRELLRRSWGKGLFLLLLLVAAGGAVWAWRSGVAAAPLFPRKILEEKLYMQAETPHPAAPMGTPPLAAAASPPIASVDLSVPPEPRPTPTSAPPPPLPSEAKRPYLLQGGSYRSTTQVIAHAHTLHTRGEEAFVFRVQIPRRGTWHRVLTGPFLTPAGAAEAAKHLTPEGGTSTPLVLTLPCMLETDPVDSLESARTLTTRFAELGCYPTVLCLPHPVKGDHRCTARLGGIRTPDHAEETARLFVQRGIVLHVVEQ